MSDSENREVFAKNLIYYMNARGKERNQICSDLNIKYTTFVGWETAKTYPRIDKIELLARYFGVMKCDLIESSKNKEIDDTFSEAGSLFLSLGKEKRVQALDYLRYLADKERE